MENETPYADAMKVLDELDVSGNIEETEENVQPEVEQLEGDETQETQEIEGKEDIDDQEESSNEDEEEDSQEGLDDEDEGVDGKSSKLKQFRLRPRNEVEDEIFKLFKGGLSLEEATNIVNARRGKTEKNEENNTPQAHKDPYSDLDQYGEIVSNIQKEIDVLEKEIEEIEEFELSTKEGLKKLSKLNDLKADLKIAKYEEARYKQDVERALDEANEAKIKSTFNQLIETFPDANDRTSPLSIAIDRRLTELEEEKSPLLQDPRIILLIASDEARRLGLAPQAGRVKGEERKPVVKKEASKPPLIPAGSVQRGSAVVHKGADSSNVLDKIKSSNDLDEISKLLDEDTSSSGELNMFTGRYS